MVRISPDVMVSTRTCGQIQTRKHNEVSSMLISCWTMTGSCPGTSPSLAQTKLYAPNQVGIPNRNTPVVHGRKQGRATSHQRQSGKCVNIITTMSALQTRLSGSSLLPSIDVFFYKNTRPSTIAIQVVIPNQVLAPNQVLIQIKRLVQMEVTGQTIVSSQTWLIQQSKETTHLQQKR